MRRHLVCGAVRQIHGWEHGASAGQRRRWTAALTVVTGLALNPVLAGQAPLPGIETKPPEPKPQAVLNLDLEALLLEAKVFATQVEDAVWMIDPGPGRSLLQLPLSVEPLDTDAELGTPSISVRGGRFIAWRIIPEQPQDGRSRFPHSRGTARPGEPGHGIRGRPGVAPGLHPGGSRYPGAPYDPGGPHDRAAEVPMPTVNRPTENLADSDRGLPAGAPTLARKLTVRSDGTLHWKLDRFLPNGTVKGSREGGSARRPAVRRQSQTERGSRARAQPGGPGRLPGEGGYRQRPTRSQQQERGTVKGSRVGGAGQADYSLKLRPQMFEELRPQRPAREARTASRQPGQREADTAEYRRLEAEFRALRQAVRDLPTQFHTKMPHRLWAVYSLSDNVPQLGLNGDAGTSSLPWQISFQTLDLLRQTAMGQGAGGDDRLEYDGYQRIARLQQVATNESHPLTHRLIAHALSSAAMVGQAQPNDPLFRLIKTLIRSEDQQARLVVIEDLAATFPQTMATAMLLREAWPHMNPALQLVALRGVFQGDPSQVHTMVASANQVLTAESGPDAGKVLDQIVANVGTRPDIMTMFIHGLRIEGLPPERRDQAIAFIIHSAGTEPLAGAWLKHRLLGSNDPTLVRRTLELLGQADTGSAALSPIASGVGRLVFGPPSHPPGARPSPKLSGPIPLDSTNHGLFRVLNSGDPEIRALGWAALSSFVISDGPIEGSPPGEWTGEPGFWGRGDPGHRSQSSQTQPDQAERYVLIMDAALGEEKIPWQLAGFLAQQPNPQQAARALVTLVLTDDPAAPDQAARALVGLPQGLGPALAGLSRTDRARFGARLYKAVTGESPGVVGLLAEDDQQGTTVAWFAGQVSAGTLPQDAEWAAVYSSEDELLMRAGSTDPELASGAAAALVASAGGDAQDSSELASAFATQTDRSTGALRDAWHQAKRQIYARRLAQSAGSYRLLVLLRGEVQTILAAAPEAVPGTEMGYMPGGPNDPRNRGFLQRPPVPVQRGVEPTEAPVSARINLGVVELVVDDQEVRLGNNAVTIEVPQERLAIRILNPGELKNFENRQLAQLPLEDLVNPLDLLPQRGGAWGGQDRLRDGRTLEVVLEPIQTP